MWLYSLGGSFFLSLDMMVNTGQYPRITETFNTRNIMIKFKDTQLSNFYFSCYVNDASQVSKSIVFFLVLLNLLIFVRHLSQIK